MYLRASGSDTIIIWSSVKVRSFDSTGTLPNSIFSFHVFRMFSQYLLNSVGEEVKHRNPKKHNQSFCCVEIVYNLISFFLTNTSFSIYYSFVTSSTSSDVSNLCITFSSLSSVLNRKLFLDSRTPYVCSCFLLFPVNQFFQHNLPPVKPTCFSAILPFTI